MSQPIRTVTHRNIPAEEAILRSDFCEMNIGAASIYLVDRQHPEFEKYRAEAIRYAEQYGYAGRVAKYKTF